MFRNIFCLLFICFIFGCSVFAEDTEVQSKTDAKETLSVTKFKGFKKNSEQKQKVMRSKDIVKTKEKIRQQELLRRQKEREIQYIERKTEEKKKILERLERAKGE